MELLQNLAYDGAPIGAQEQAQLTADIDRENQQRNRNRELPSQGYLDAPVLWTKAITVVVPVTLVREEAARIGELVHRLTGIRLERITIVDETSRV